jgi:hypothetical protein
MNLNPLPAIVNALNGLRSNVWAVVLIMVGISLVLHGHPQEGGSLITGSFAIFRTSVEPTSSQAPQDPQQGH